MFLTRLMSCSVLASLVALTTFGCAAPPHVTVTLADLPADRIVDASWSDATIVDEQPCRVVPAGKTATFTLPKWWGRSSTPSEGSMCLATVRYKDTVDKPARFLAYAGLNGGHGPTEMHRFGGLADNQWKVAHVPLAWDTIISLPSDNGMTRLTIHSPGGDLPVASVEIGPIDDGAQARYNAETRDWVRRVQAIHGEPTATLSQTQQPVLSDRWANAPMVPFSRSYMKPIFPHSAPQKGEAARPIRIQLATNEYEPASLGVYANTADLKNVTFQVSDLTGPAGTLTVDIDKRTAEYCLVETRGKLATFGQRLWPMYPVDIAKGQSHWFWITLKTDPATAKPGTYRGMIKISGDKAWATLPIEVEVLPIKLATMDQAGLLMGGCSPSLIPAHEISDQFNHNLNMFNLWSSMAGSRLAIVDGKVQLDFELMDHWMALARKNGFKAAVWFVGGNPYGYPRTLSLERNLYVALHNGEKPREELVDDFIRLAASEEFRGKPMPELQPYYHQWIAQVWQHAKANNWPELIMTPFDEPAKWVQGPYRKPGETHPDIIGAGPWIKDHFKAACAIMKQAAPDMRIYGSIHHNHVPDPTGEIPVSEFRAIHEGEIFIPDVDCFCTNAIHEDPSLGDKVRAAGKHFWQYSGVGDTTQPDQARFTFGFFFNAFNSRGSLIWAYDWGNGFDTTTGYNWMIAWRTPFDVIPSAFYEALREAWDDRRYVETLKQTADELDVDISGFLDMLAKDGAALRGPGGRDTVDDFWAQATDLDQIDQMRDRVITKLLKLKQ